MANQFNHISDTYNEDLSKYEYAVRFGNAYWGWGCNKDQLKKLWAHCIRLSRSQYPGDVSLFYKGQLIRSMWNGEIKILNKEHRYPYTVNKYDEAGVQC